MTRRFGSVGIVIGLGGLLGALEGCGGREADHAEVSAVPRAVPVTVAPLVRRPVERTVEVVGSLRGWESVTLGAKRTGRVAKVFHDMGDRLKPGERLVEMETVDADLAVVQAERRLQVELARLGLQEMPSANFDLNAVPSVIQAQVSVERSRQNLVRERNLMQRNAGTAQDLQNSENDLRGTEAALETARLTTRSNLASALASKVALDVARQARIDMEIHAPVPSVNPPGLKAPLTYALTKRQASEGQMLKEGEAVAELVIEDPLRLWTYVPERHSGDVKLGQPVRISISSHPGKVFDGVVARINPSVDAASRTFQVEASVPNPEGVLRPGGFAKASILIKRDDEATIVPMESIVRFAGVTKLFLVQGDKARSVNVLTGLEGKGWIEVTGEGASIPGTGQVVTSGQTQLADDTPVTIRVPEGPAVPRAEAAAKPRDRAPL
jgi:membrane fusion protein (multidrug efflux system)